MGIKDELRRSAMGKAASIKERNVHFRYSLIAVVKIAMSQRQPYVQCCLSVL